MTPCNEVKITDVSGEVTVFVFSIEEWSKQLTNTQTTEGSKDSAKNYIFCDVASYIIVET
jgi:hypothetical protein